MTHRLILKNDSEITLQNFHTAKFLDKVKKNIFQNNFFMEILENLKKNLD